ncbi:MAG: SPASM domain-containing protein [Phycisphaeraceae bacterium]|nr:SPASM domain-containing protein [Phycisphaeraceae bacterium]
MSSTLAIVIADRQTNRLGLPSRIANDLGGKSVLQQTVLRLDQIKSVRKIVIVHPLGQDLSDLVTAGKKPLLFHADPDGLTDKFTNMRQVARKWAMPNWRGGLGGATCYDELLPAKPIYDAAKAHGGDAVILVGGDWPLVDPEFCEQTLAIHLEHPENMQMTFNQAPPGLSGIVISTNLLAEMASSDGSSVGNMLAYVPAHPQADPIGRDICYAIPPIVRSLSQRLIYDNPHSIAMIDQLKINFEQASAVEIVSALNVPLTTPGQVTIELTPQRIVNGPLIPQHYQSFDRKPISMDILERILKGLAPQSLVTFGGLGDAMLHPQWDQAVKLAHESGAMGICIQTDLQSDWEQVKKILDLPIDIVTVWLNADTAATYEKLCEPVDSQYTFKHITDNLQGLLNERNRRWQSPEYDIQPGVPWIIPHLIKVADNLKDMETFFDRWMHYTQQAVILPSQEGCGLMPHLGPVQMAPPTRFACRQISRRITILSDGTVAQCDQDWQAKAPLGSLAKETLSLSQLWDQKGKSLCQAHEQLNLDSLKLCKQCHEWHRP